MVGEENLTSNVVWRYGHRGTRGRVINRSQWFISLWVAPVYCLGVNVWITAKYQLAVSGRCVDVMVTDSLGVSYYLPPIGAEIDYLLREHCRVHALLLHVSERMHFHTS